MVSRRTALAAAWGTAGVLTTGIAGGAAYSATHRGGEPASKPSPSATSQAQRTGGRDGCGAQRRITARALHGEFVIATRRGDRDVAIQRGKITAISPTMLHVTSKDNVDRSYRLDQSTRIWLNRHRVVAGKLARGDQAFVVTSPQQGTHTAGLVVARTANSSSGGRRACG